MTRSGASAVVLVTDQAQRYRFYAEIEADTFDPGVVSFLGMPRIAVALELVAQRSLHGS